MENLIAYLKEVKFKQIPKKILKKIQGLLKKLKNEFKQEEIRKTLKSPKKLFAIFLYFGVFIVMPVDIIRVIFFQNFSKGKVQGEVTVNKSKSEPTPSGETTPTASPSGSITPTETPTPTTQAASTEQPTNTPQPVQSSSATPTPTKTPTPTTKLTLTPTATPSATISPTQTPTPTLGTPTPTPTSGTPTPTP